MPTWLEKVHIIMFTVFMVVPMTAMDCLMYSDTQWSFSVSTDSVLVDTVSPLMDSYMKCPQS